MSLARPTPVPKVLFICGSINQTTQMLAIARELPGTDAYFTPYYGDEGVEVLRRAGMIEFTIAGNKAICSPRTPRHDCRWQARVLGSWHRGGRWMRVSRDRGHADRVIVDSGIG